MQLVLRQAVANDIGRLMAFYREGMTERLPAPLSRELGGSIDTGRLLVVEPAAGGDILAASAIFDYSPVGWRTYVGELSGTRVMEHLNGYRPLGMQRILLAARLLGHAANESDLEEGMSACLLTIIKSDNDKSIRNIEAAGLARLGAKPGWLQYDEYAWNHGPAGDDWSYYVASEATVRRAFADLEGLGFFRGPVRLTRTSRETGEEETVTVRSDLRGLLLNYEDLRAIHAEERLSGLGPPPDTLAR